MKVVEITLLVICIGDDAVKNCPTKFASAYLTTLPVALSAINIKSLLDAVTVPADWVGIREVYESNTPRMIRDGVPVSNGHYATHGAMIEVLVNGQFGYYGTPDLTKNGIELASKKAFDQAKAASRYALHTFTDEVRPKNIGKYSSPFEKDLRSMSAKDLNMLLLDAYKLSLIHI